MDLSDVNNAAYLASSLCCIAAITALASQKTSRLGNVLGLTGVSSGLAITLGMLQPNPDLLTQMLGCLLIGGSVGGIAASKIEVTNLPQMVALFHSLVGIAAVLTCISNYIIEAPILFSNADLCGAGNLMKTVAYLGTWIGGILNSKPLILPMRHALNASLVGISTAGLAAFLATEGSLDNPMLPLSLLIGGAALAGSVSGVTLTTAIGGWFISTISLITSSVHH
ncbi:unnamed protein product [Rodentolepis nana]|uniref:proton-translocating NAD(P)(+) transhydrogenase n=1 Tax=Rodentolepis nana TaxID=102285 RepID=A0A0R3THY2_RODNA|nr:unnamed protein product [Rodentolepis nana]